MKKTFFVLVFLFCAASAFCQEKISFFDTTYISKSERSQILDRYNCVTAWYNKRWPIVFEESVTNLKDGQYEIYADTAFTLLAAEGSVVNGKFSGVWTYYYDNHNIQTKCSYKNGELNGPWTYYLRNGVKRTETTYVNNKIDGEFKHYWYYTDPFDRYNYDGYGTVYYKQGLLQGKAMYWTKDSTEKVFCNYKDNKLDGAQIHLNQYGDTLRIEYYDNGKKVSEKNFENTSYETTYSLRISCHNKNFSTVDSILRNLDKYKNLEKVTIFYGWNNTDKNDAPIYDSIVRKHIYKLTQLPRLTEITYSGNCANKQPPIEIFQCKKIKKITLLRECELQSLPNELLQLPNLTYIDISGARVADREATIQLLSKIKPLKEIKIWETNLPQNLQLLQQIDALYIGDYGSCSDWPKMDSLPNGLFKLKNLKSLQICQSQIEYYLDRFNKEMPNTLILMYETCFDKNTTVELCDSRKINIDKIKINDVIMAYDTESQTIDTAVVLNVMKHKVDLYPMITLTLSNGTQTKCTNNHPFWCNEKWTRADELRIHDVLQVYDEKSRSLKPVTITDLRMSAESMEVYNITTSKHTYFANGVLVHNK
ncbi:MAG: hypothetical protein J5588_04495 [Bacteroidales bacterium]|nr:hypothetical protein [Bacteroidales bacterium]